MLSQTPLTALKKANKGNLIHLSQIVADTNLTIGQPPVHESEAALYARMKTELLNLLDLIHDSNLNSLLEEELTEIVVSSLSITNTYSGDDTTKLADHEWIHNQGPPAIIPDSGDIETVADLTKHLALDLDLTIKEEPRKNRQEAIQTILSELLITAEDIQSEVRQEAIIRQSLYLMLMSDTTYSSKTFLAVEEVAVPAAGDSSDEQNTSSPQYEEQTISVTVV